MRIRFAAAPLLLLILLLPSASGAEEFWYAQTLQMGRMGAQMTHFWSKGPSMRAESVIRGHRVVSLVSGDFYYAYDLLAGEGVAVRRGSKARKQDQGRTRPFGHEGKRLIERGAEKVRTEDAGGRVCDVYRLTDTRGRTEACVTPDEGRFPLWVEILSRKTGDKSRITYLTWFQPDELPQRFFEPEPHVQLQRFEYEQYLEQAAKGPVGPVPILYGDLLHGRRDQP